MFDFIPLQDFRKHYKGTFDNAQAETIEEIKTYLDNIAEEDQRDVEVLIVALDADMVPYKTVEAYTTDWDKAGYRVVNDERGETHYVR